MAKCFSPAILPLLETVQSKGQTVYFSEVLAVTDDKTITLKCKRLNIMGIKSITLEKPSTLDDIKVGEVISIRVALTDGDQSIVVAPF